MSTSKKITNLCFVGNFHKTWVFHAIAQKLKKQGVEISWIVTKQEQYDFLKAEYGAESVLYINRSFIDKPNPPVDDFRLNELLFSDRVLKHEMKNGLKFLTHIQKPIYEFLSKNKTRFIIGEITWAHEVLLERIAKRPELNCVYLQCNDIRMPNGRFGFFLDETECDMMQFDNPTANEMIVLQKPKYLALNDKILKRNISLAGRLNRIKRFWTGENIEENDPNVITNKVRRFKIASQDEINKTEYYNRIKTTPFEEIENEKFIFFGFHKQPENTIDVFGRYYEDQTTIVTNLWRLLPTGWKLVVKEHTNAVGDRPYKFYKNILKYPNIILANEKINSKILIEKSQLVVTVAGTMGYEAALMKKPAVTFGRVFFNQINYCRKMTLDELVEYGNLTDLVTELENQPDNRLEFSNYLLKNTFEGYITDSVTDPTVMEDANIEKLSYGFLSLVNRHS